jgi:hypothetical protein
MYLQQAGFNKGFEINTHGCHISDELVRRLFKGKKQNGFFTLAAA